MLEGCGQLKRLWIPPGDMIVISVLSFCSSATRFEIRWTRSITRKHKKQLKAAWRPQAKGSLNRVDVFGRHAPSQRAPGVVRGSFALYSLDDRSL
ncbi:hypothetical protein GZH47_10745 [Paenibacillus rhizovicinus]|uniref:Uncharacterized protein n=1 Tax=Paenibacillus rhizovicinus TaxID=2704463 RepID=A0A6C0NZC1_9BACL|nr:hypothetical protein [Paenibacillus rhizovicinus]QHW31286.1 hypothetical protein GZH47_10745 [Paenibacillus rhizovicinus]